MEKNSSPNQLHFLPTEEKVIEQKLALELVDKCYRLLKDASIVTIIGALVPVWALYRPQNIHALFSWYAAMFIVHAASIFIVNSWQKQQANLSEPGPWLYLLRGTVFISAITWGSMGLLLVTNDAQTESFILFFLTLASSSVTLGTLTDHKCSVIGIISTLLPFIGWQFYQLLNHVPGLHLQSAITLILYMGLLLAISYVGCRQVRKSAELGFINQALSEKLMTVNTQLTEANTNLENRVKERTLELEESLQKVTYQATHDLLTDLPNSRLLSDYLDVAITTANQQVDMFAVAFFTINEIQKISDGLGHQVGENVISTIANRFKKLFQQENANLATPFYTLTLSRKDEFVILLKPIHTPDEVEKKARVLFSVLEEHVNINEHSLKLTACIGISVYPQDGADKKTLLMNADAATLNHESGGNSLYIYKSEVNADLSKQLELSSDLHKAVKNGEFLLHYQPFVDLKTGEICGMEALIRWKHPTRGLVPPMDFIALAESNGMIIPLGEWVLRTACKQLKSWHQQGFTSLKVSVNLSAQQLQQNNIAETITQILNETDLSSEFLELELTETEAFKADTIPILEHLIAMGLSLLIDDYGTGYSGLSNLKLLTIKKLKIDKSFVQDITTNKDTQIILINTITMAKDLKIQVLAEGVETKQQLEFLRDNGCDMIQGYYFSRPVIAEAFTKLLASHEMLLLS